jgi:hypothetical protein
MKGYGSLSAGIVIGLSVLAGCATKDHRPPRLYESTLSEVQGCVSLKASLVPCRARLASLHDRDIGFSATPSSMLEDLTDVIHGYMADKADLTPRHAGAIEKRLYDIAALLETRKRSDAVEEYFRREKDKGNEVAEMVESDYGPNIGNPDFWLLSLALHYRRMGNDRAASEVHRIIDSMPPYSEAFLMMVRER